MNHPMWLTPENVSQRMWMPTKDLKITPDKCNINSKSKLVNTPVL